MTSVMPTATSSVGALLTSKVSQISAASKNDGAMMPTHQQAATQRRSRLNLAFVAIESSYCGPPAASNVPSATAQDRVLRRLVAVEDPCDRSAAASPRCGRSCRGSPAARTRSSGSPLPAPPAPSSARGSPPSRRRRCPASARRESAPTALSPASGSARPSADCRPKCRHAR